MGTKSVSSVGIEAYNKNVKPRQTNAPLLKNTAPIYIGIDGTPYTSRFNDFTELFSVIYDHRGEFKQNEKVYVNGYEFTSLGLTDFSKTNEQVTFFLSHEVRYASPGKMGTF